MKGVSVIICCYNSASRIQQTLSYLSAQKVSQGIEWEIILVNNNSTDNTAEIAFEFWKNTKSPAELRIVEEATPGLTYARICGLNNASYEAIIFCDDDNWLDANYITTSYQILEKNPKIGIMGGQIEPAFEVNPPTWFPRFAFAYAVGSQAEKTGDISNRKFVWGAGMVMRRTIWEKIKRSGYSFTTSDRNKSNLSSGGDAEFSLLSLVLGYQLYYSDALKLKHFISKGRMSWQYIKKLTKGFGISEAQLVPLTTLVEKKITRDTLRESLVNEIKILPTLFHLISHPKKILKTLVDKEGEPSTLWFHHNNAKLSYLIKSKNHLEETFKKNGTALKNLLDSKNT